MPNEFDPAEVLTLPLMANLATLAADSTPRNAPVWFAWEDGSLWMLSDTTSSSATRIAANPNVAVEIVHYDNAEGLLRHVGLRGTATVAPMDTARFERLLQRYLGPKDTQNQWFIDQIARIDDPSGRLIRLTPDSIFTNDVSYFRTGPKLAHKTSDKSTSR